MTAAPTLKSLDDMLPEALPKTERVLWQGAPEWKALARDGLHARGLAFYLVLLVVSVAAAAAWRGAGPGAVALDAARAAGFAAVPMAVVLGYAWLSARAARYVVTDRRVVLRVGVALPITINLPFARIAAADLRKTGATGEIALTLSAQDGLAAIMIWPHSPFMRVRPTLRGLRDPALVGQILSGALAASADVPAVATRVTSVPLAQFAASVESAGAGHGAQTVAA